MKQQLDAVHALGESVRVGGQRKGSATGSPILSLSFLCASHIADIVMCNGLTIVQSSSSQSALPVFKELVSGSKDRILLFSFLYPPELFTSEQNNLTVIDWTDRIKGYSDEPLDLLENIPTGKPRVV